MSLDTEKLHKLKGKGFDKMYEKHPDKWQQMVETARDYAKTCVPEGEKVRIGDIVTVVQTAIKIDPEFEKYVQGKGLTQKYWAVWFAEFIIDQVYPQPELEG